MTARPLAIFGGSFDPVHAGHLAVAALAREYLCLDKVVFVPAGAPPHKLGTVGATSAQRCAMLRRALAAEPAFTLSLYEVRKKAPSYSVETVAFFRARYPGCPLFFIVGSDNLTQICTWHRWEELVAGVTLCVAHRPGFSMRVPQFLRDADIRFFPSPRWGISSTMIRGYLRRGLSCAWMLPPAVAEYIRVHRLYQAANG